MIYYSVMPGANFTTSAGANTEIDAMFIKPGAARTLFLTAANAGGKAANATALSGIVNRIKVWTATASSGGTGITPSPTDGRAGQVASSATAGQATAGIISGTGGPQLRGLIVSGVSTQAPFDCLNNLDRAIVLDAGANQSIDFFNSSGAVSLPFELAATIAE